MDRCFLRSRTIRVCDFASTFFILTGPLMPQNCAVDLPPRNELTQSSVVSARCLMRWPDRRPAHRFSLIAIGSLLIVAGSFSAARSADDDQKLLKAWLKVSETQAAHYEITLASRPDQKLKRLEKPVFRHAQPARGNDIGAVWLWTDETGRPAVIGDIFAWSLGGEMRTVSHEFHSLAESPLNARYESRLLWKPAGAGLEWKPIPNAPAPAETSLVRQRQMQTLSQRFTANSIDLKNSPWELRLVPKPVYQYELTDQTLIQAGSLFAVCQGTDPELWLLIEIRKIDGMPVWAYAIAPFTDYALRVRLDGQQVWQCDKFEHGFNNRPHWIQSVFEQVSLPQDGESSTKP